jgi:hypothetical protein
MKLNDYIHQLNKMVEANPEILNYEVVYEAYDNNFQIVPELPTVGIFVGKESNFTVKSPVPFIQQPELNAICIPFFQ